MRDTADAEALKKPEWTPAMAIAMASASMCHDEPPISVLAAYRESDLAKSNAQRKVVFKYVDGKEVSLCLDSNFKPQYKDEYTNEVWPQEQQHMPC